MRDGYDVSRIVYINDVPYYVDDDRRTRAVPDRLHNRFEYRVVVPQQGGDRRGDERSQPQKRYDDRESQPVPPASGREQERQESSAHGRERERETSLQDKGRIGDDEPLRGRSQTPAGTEQYRGRSQTVSQPAKPVVDDRKTRTVATKGEDRRTDTAAEKKNEKTKGRDRDRDRDERKMREEGEDRDGNAEDARKTRRE